MCKNQVKYLQEELRCCRRLRYKEQQKFEYVLKCLKEEVLQLRLKDQVRVTQTIFDEPV